MIAEKFSGSVRPTAVGVSESRGEKIPHETAANSIPAAIAALQA
jgi:hypothetical protein